MSLKVDITSSANNNPDINLTVTWNFTVHKDHRIPMCVYMYFHVWIRICVCIYIFVWIYVCVDTCMCVCIHITSWEIDGETVETVSDFIFLGSKVTADGDYSHEIKRPLLLGIKAMTILDSILKSRDITLPTKVHLVKAVVFPVVMYGCESWTVKKAER